MINPGKHRFCEGTSVKEALSETRKRELSAKAEAVAQDTVDTTGRGLHFRRQEVTSKTRHMKNLKQFYIGQFELIIDDADVKWLKEELEDKMLIRNDEQHTARQDA